ncbi:hypothetical protein H5410_032129 [Solanum commersonii]|uniref:Uncharacterized protein n=1 Tax=Solanum commersonii TaxID=4109 RepID=A0A9J5YLZ6_SOLCO|nr:hypothetical protein H5410_032129 [Solanum commersonii]
MAGGAWKRSPSLIVLFVLPLGMGNVIISAMILTKMKETVGVYLGKKINDAVITVSGNVEKRQATKDAGVISGLNVARIINEPTAATIAYGLDKKGGKKNILVCDLGGGTFDVSILTIDNGVFEVLAINGDTHLGLIESLFDGVDFSEPLTRARFEELNNDLFRKTMGPVKKAMEDAGLRKNQIDEIVLVGISTRIPEVQQLLKLMQTNVKAEDKASGKSEKITITNDKGRLSQEEIERMVKDKKVKERIDSRNILETYVYNKRNQINDQDKLADKLDSDEKEKIETATKEALEWLDDNQSAEKEDYDEKLKEVEVRSGGAPGRESSADDDGDHDELQHQVRVEIESLFDGVDFSESLTRARFEELNNDLFRKTMRPVKKAMEDAGLRKNQIDEIVLVGISTRIPEVQQLLKDCRQLGKFDLTGVAPALRGTPQIEVTFAVDANGILTVKDEDKAPGKSEKITITNDKGRLSREEIEHMVKEAEEFAEEDKK